jgi:hypothetical protein
MRSLTSSGLVGLGLVVLAACGGGSSTITGTKGDGGTGSSSGGEDGGGENEDGGATSSGGSTSSGSTSSGGSTSGGSSSSGSTTDSGTDSGSDSGPDAAITCAAPVAVNGQTDVYVDQKYTGTQQLGNQACPFKTITAGLSFANPLTGTRIVHVAGAAAGGTIYSYMEAGTLVIDGGVTLQGPGAAAAEIIASGATACLGTGNNCAVVVDANATIDGFTVTNANGVGIQTAAPPLAGGAPVVSNTTVTETKGNGIEAYGDATIGPKVDVEDCGKGAAGGAGLEGVMGATGTLTVHDSTFSNNANGNGINIDGDALLALDTVTANNDAQGVRLAGAGSSVNAPHTLTALTVENNTGPGGMVNYNGQNIKVRKSIFLANKGAGLAFTYTALGGGSIDIGPLDTDMGGNTFAGNGTLANNTQVGLRICGALAATAVTADGDDWTACPTPTKTKTPCGNAAPPAYADIFYDNGTVTVTNCTVGQ